MNRLLSPENATRVALITETLMYSGMGHALLGGVLLSENLPEMIKWTVVAPAAVWIIGLVVMRDMSMHADSTVGWAIGLMSVGVEALLKMGQSETGGFLHAITFGAMTLLGATVTANAGRSFIRQFIHPQVSPRE